MPDVIALAGGTGFTGRRVAAGLADARGAAALRCLVRAESDTSVLPAGVPTVRGDLGDAESLSAWLEGADALVYVASMGFGHVPAVVAAAESAGVRRAVFVSTTAIRTRLPAPSKSVRIAAEDAVRDSSFASTILRPTMIYGAPGDRNMERLLRAVARWPLVPVPGTGRYLIQPVHVDDLSAAIVSATLTIAASGREYDLSGDAPLSFDDTLRTAGRALGRHVRLIHVPLRPVAFILRCMESVGLRPRVTEEQVLRLAEDKAFAHVDATRDLAFNPRSLETGLAAEARLLALVPSGDSA